jgi:hypothetical protein
VKAEKPEKERDMTTKRASLPVALCIVGAIALYVHAHPNVPPKPVTVTIAQGTNIELRLDKTLGSRTSSAGEPFSGKLVKPIVEGGTVIVPEGTEFSGKVLQAVPVGRLAGGASLRIALTSFSLEEKQYAVESNQILRVSHGNGKRTAEFAGGGAALGAAIGALAHGGKGALIGAAVGAGAGTAGSAATSKAHDIVLPSQTPLSFKLTQPVAITAKPAPRPDNSSLAALVRGWFS